MSRRRGATTRRGMVDGVAVAFALARAHGGIQTLGAHVRDPARQKRSKAVAFTSARSRTAVQHSW
jgi:hypothetical protein